MYKCLYIECFSRFDAPISMADDSVNETHRVWIVRAHLGRKQPIRIVATVIL